MTKSEFCKELNRYLNNSFEKDFGDEIIIEELAESGKGDIKLDISHYTLNERFFFIKINHKQEHLKFLTNDNHCDGIVLKVDLNRNFINIYIFELKKTVTKDKLLKAKKQSTNAYFLSELLFKNFDLEYKFIIVYKQDGIHYGSLKSLNSEDFEFIDSFIKSKNEILFELPFFKDKYFNFEKRVFSDKFTI